MPGTNRGVYKSSDGAASWQAHTAGLGKVMVQVLAIHPAMTTVLYAGTSDGLFVSRDGGGQWAAVAPLTGHDIRAVLVEPSTVASSMAEDLLWVGTTAGLYRYSADADTLMLVEGGLPNGTVNHVAASDVQTLYVAIAGAGVYQSNDGGVTWQAANEGLTNLDPTVIATASGDEHRLYVGTAQDGIFARYKLLNSDVALVSGSVRQQYNVAPDILYPTESPTGVFTISAEFLNPADNAPLTALTFQVVQLDNGNLLLDADARTWWWQLVLYTDCAAA